MLKRTGLHIMILILLAGKCFGQISPTDSLYEAIADKPDTVKLRILREQAEKEQNKSLRIGLEHADRRMEIARGMQDYFYIADTWHVYGNLYLVSSLYSSAEENYMKALHLFDSLGRDENKASILHNLGLLHYNRHDTLKAIEYYRKSIELRKKGLDKRRVGDELTTLGETYLSFGDYDTSRKYLLEALDYYRDIQNYRRKADTYAFLFDASIVSGEGDAKNWLDSLIIESDGFNSKVYESMINIRQCRYFLANDMPDSTAFYLDSVNFGLLNQHEVLDPVELINSLAERYRQDGKQYEAIQYRMIYRNKRDQMTDREVKDLVDNYNVRLSISASEDEIELKELQNELILSRIRTEKIISMVLYLALAITIIALVYLILNVNTIRRTSKKLAVRRNSLQEAYERSSIYKEKILDIRENKNDFFSIVSLKLSRPFTSLTTKLTDISIYLSDNNKDLKLKTMMERLYKDASGIEKGLKRILLWSKLQRSKFIINQDNINPDEFLHEMLPSLLGIALKKDIRIRFDVDPELKFKYDRSSLNTIITILVENSVQYSSPASDIIIRTQRSKTGCVISVTDFGIGIPDEIQERIFDLSRVKAQKPDLESHNIGLGLLIAKMLSEKNDSDISLESEIDKGTTVFIHIKECDD